MNWFTNLLRSMRKTAVRHAPGILMGMGTVGVGSAVILAAKAGPKAVILTEQAEMEKAKTIQPVEEGGKCLRVPLTWKEKLAATYKLYIPPVGLTVFGLMCFWAAHGIDLKRQAVVAGLYSTAEATLQEYQRKVVDILGEKQADEIRQSIGDDRVAQAQKNLPPPPEDYDLGTQKWCYLYGRRFPCSYNRIKEVQNEINELMFREMYASEADLFYKLDPTGEWLRADDAARMTGWTVDNMLVLRVNNASSPTLDIVYEDKNGLAYLPEPGYSQMY
jgi:hypothetical protein